MRSWVLKYSDDHVNTELYLEDSPSEQYDLVGSDEDLQFLEKEKVVRRILEWGLKQNLKIKLWKPDELGI